MFKLAGMLLIGAGFFAGGMYFASRQTKKCGVITDVLLMLSVTATQLRYACLPVPDLLRILCDTQKLSSLGFIVRCKEKTDGGIPFPEAWKTAVESDYELCSLLGEHLNYLVQLGTDIGTTDVEGQLACCEYYKQIFEKELILREENAKKYKKVCPLLGLMLGISAAIIII